MQNSGPWDPWLPVVENRRLFAQPGHSARCAPKASVLGGGGLVPQSTGATRDPNSATNDNIIPIALSGLFTIGHGLVRVKGGALVHALPGLYGAFSCFAALTTSSLLRIARDRPSKGAFSHSARTAPIITVIIQVTTLKTTHLRNHAQSIQNSTIQTSDACHGSQGPKFCPL